MKNTNVKRIAMLFIFTMMINIMAPSVKAIAGNLSIIGQEIQLFDRLATATPFTRIEVLRTATPTATLTATPSPMATLSSRMDKIATPTPDNSAQYIKISELTTEIIVPSPTPVMSELTRKLGGALATLEKINQVLEPASLDTTYKLKKNVLTLKKGELSKLLQIPSKSADMDKLLAQEKINNGVMIQKNVLEQYIPNITQTAIVYDEVENLTAKVDMQNIGGTSAGPKITRPQIAELVDDIAVNPSHKTVKLNEANLRYSNQNNTVLKSLLANSKPALKSGEMQLMSGVMPALVDVNIPEGTEFEAISSDGAAVKVQVSGYFKIRNIDVSASYSFMSGYDVIMSTGIDAKLSAKFSIYHGVVAIPLYGIDIPAGVANVSGGIFLVINNNGDFSLMINAESHVGASAGISGGTFFGVPTSVNPVFQPVFNFKADPSFAGQINGTITVGPYVNLNVFGFDIVSANVGIGAGVDSKVVTENGSEFLDCDVYGCIGANASAFGEGVCLADFRLPLYSFRVENTQGYKLNFYEIDAYTKHVSGKLEFDYGEGLKGMDNGYFYLSVERANSQRPVFNKVKITTNENGEFDADLNQELYAGDKVTIVDIYNLQKDKVYNPTFKKVTPTIPFKEPVLEYADFYNNTIKGHIAPAFKANKVTGEEKVVFYNGDIELIMKKTPKRNIDGSAFVTVDTLTLLENLPSINLNSKLGKFFIQRDDVPTNLVVQPVLAYNDFVLLGNTRVADTELVGNRLILDEKRVPTSMIGVYDYSCRELFYVKNMRGTKQVDTIGIYKPISFTEWKMDNSIVYMSMVKIKEKKNFYRIVKPVQDNEILSNTNIISTQKFNVSGNDDMTPEIAQFVKSQEIGGTSVIETNFHYITNETFEENLHLNSGEAENILITNNKPDKDSEKLKEITWGGMVGRVVVDIKGVPVVVADPNDIVPKEESEALGKGQYSKGDILITEKIWSRINPNPVENIGINLYNSSVKIKEDTANVKTIDSAIVSDIKLSQNYVMVAEQYNLENNKSINVYTNGKKIDFSKYDGITPIISYGRTLVPIRALSEALGAVVNWDAKTNGVTIVKDGRTVLLTLNSVNASVNEKLVKLDVPASMIGERIMVPIRFVSETFNQNVGWYSQKNGGGVISVIAK